jgi:hypothetical protein
MASNNGTMEYTCHVMIPSLFLFVYTTAITLAEGKRESPLHLDRKTLCNGMNAQGTFVSCLYFYKIKSMYNSKIL